MTTWTDRHESLKYWFRLAIHTAHVQNTQCVLKWCSQELMAHTELDFWLESPEFKTASKKTVGWGVLCDFYV